MTHTFRITWLLPCATILAGVACSTTDESDPGARLERGREIVRQMSDTLAAAKALSVATHEVRTEQRPDGTERSVTIDRRTVIRRPDRLHFTASGDRQVEGWYDGVGLTLALHGDRVFAQARMPETLDRTLDAIAERYGVALPMADLLYASPVEALVRESSTGGWVGVEDGEVDHVSFRDTGVTWDLWISRADHLPVRGRAEFSGRRRLGRVEVSFSEWNLSPPIGQDQFAPRVPADYEGIAMLQRASVLRAMPDEAPAATSGRQ